MMILHGGPRSPFVRRVAIWLDLHGLVFERHLVGVFGSDFEPFKQFNPLGRVPVLTIAPDEHLIETAAITDYLEDLAPPSARLIPATGPARRHCQQRLALANAVTEKGVAFVYETERRPPELVWPQWRDRLSGQVATGLAALEAVTPHSGWMGGAQPDGSDIAAVCAYDFLAGTAALDPSQPLPKLQALATRASAISAFSLTQPVVG